MKFSRWAKNGIIQSIFDELQKQKFIDIQSEALCLDDTSIKGYPNASVARKISNEKYWSLKKGGTTKIHAACVSEKFALKIQLSAGNRHDAPEGPRLIESFSCKVG